MPATDQVRPRRPIAPATSAATTRQAVTATDGPLRKASSPTARPSEADSPSATNRRTRDR
ncbi:hypothetical protein [Streptomyces sp. NPDC101149]|uniref:hypothetical protein n=1 Tax=Streptomyces sp. NPDC101149 TaxID=3366113 RepID=UPI0038238BC3